MSNHFRLAWQTLVGIEGGYTNHPSDPGGETNHGVTALVARAHGYTGDMRRLPKSRAERIAKLEYWDPLRLDEVADLSYPIAYELFDTNFNLFPLFAGRALQRSLNLLNQEGQQYGDVVVDGRIGPATIAALEKYLKRRGWEGETVLLRCLNGLQLAEYARQCEVNPAKEAFFFGWVRERVKI